MSTHKRKIIDTNATIRIAYKGLPYSFTHNAATRFFQEFNQVHTFDFVPKQSLSDVFEAIKAGESQYGVLAVESSSFGTIQGVYDRLLGSDGKAVIVGEFGQIEHLSLCLPNSRSVASDVDIDEIVSHPHILDCCHAYLDGLDRRRQEAGKGRVLRTATWDTAEACSSVASSASSSTLRAAICSKEAAGHYNMRIFEETVGNDKNAETRYVIVAKKENHHIIDLLNIQQEGTPSNRTRTARVKCTFALAMRNIPGAIFKMSSCFAFRNLDINRIESRPATLTMNLQSGDSAHPFTKRHWDLVFFIDFEPSTDAAVNHALRNNLMDYCEWVKELGTYRSDLQIVDVEPCSWTKDMLSY